MRTGLFVWLAVAGCSAPSLEVLSVEADPSCDASVEVNGVSCTDCRFAPGARLSVSHDSACDHSWAACPGMGDCVATDSTTLTVRRRTWPVTFRVEGPGRLDVGQPCDGGCVVAVAVGQDLSFSVAPAFGHDADVTPRACDTAGVCRLAAVDQPVEVRVQFVAATRQLEVRVEGSGVVEQVDGGLSCRRDGGTCQASFPRGAAVRLRASVAPGAADAAVQWSNPSCAGAECDVPMDVDRQLSAAVLSVFAISVAGDGGGRVRIDGVTRSLPASLDVLEGTALSLEAVPGPDDSFFEFTNLPCDLPVPTMSCRFQVNTNLDGGLTFLPFIHAVLDLDAAGGQQGVSNFVSRPDGGLWGFGRSSGSSNLIRHAIDAGTTPTGPTRDFMFTLDEDLRSEPLSLSSSASGLGQTRLVTSRSGKVWVVAGWGITPGPRSYSWGAYDSGVWADRSGDDLVVLELSSAGDVVNGTWLSAAATEGSFGPLESTSLIEFENKRLLFFGVRGRFPQTFPSLGGSSVVTTAIIDLNQPLSPGNPTLWRPVSKNGPVVSDNAVWVETFGAASGPCPASGPGVELRKFEPASLSCSATTAVPGSLRRTVAIRDDLVSCFTDGTTAPELGLQRTGPTGALLWRWRAERVLQPLVASVAGLHLVHTRDTLLATWLVSGTMRDPSTGVELRCAGAPSTPYLLFTQHRPQDGSLIWYHCLSGLQNTQFPFLSPTPRGAVGYFGMNQPVAGVTIGSRTASGTMVDNGVIVQLFVPPAR